MITVDELLKQSHSFDIRSEHLRRLADMLHLRYYQLHTLLGIHLPALSAHLDAIGADVRLFACPWFTSCFDDCFPEEQRPLLWRAVREQGHGLASVRIALAILQAKQGSLLRAETAQDAARAVKSFRVARGGGAGAGGGGASLSAEELLEAARRFPVAEDDLDAIEKAYFGSQA